VSRVVALDAGAVDALVTEPAAAGTHVRAVLRAAHRLGRSVTIPSLVLAELYRGGRRDAGVDSFINRQHGIELRDTDRGFARLVGGLLAAAELGSEAIVDAHVVAAVVEQGGGVCVTGDARDLERIAAPYRNVTIVAVS
jgi:hypothetical protein